MKKNLILLSALFLIGITQVNAQCCKPTDSKVKKENTTQQEGKTVKLKITGMTCTGCSNHISNTLKEVDGIIEHKVKYPGDLATIQYDPKKTNPDTIIRIVEKIGYKAEIIKETQKKKA
ncbi:copper chaperone CopZ [Flavobacterium sp. 103]|jgi:mercuric ion binding protein|uniref:Copper chaperone n=2 Tax=Flavobacterium TaxID=237 RepID=A0A2W7TS49_9FLAO|nr:MULTISPECIES: heavy-metal-associated domain-containing protein [Flavobacterium]PVX47560.1 copper chaperone CopZ [Flavobacterium sp. 103]PZX93403.1 copper chaperone [Flavobacterium aquariorum]